MPEHTAYLQQYRVHPPFISFRNILKIVEMNEKMFPHLPTIILFYLYRTMNRYYEMDSPAHSHHRYRSRCRLHYIRSNDDNTSDHTSDCYAFCPARA
jgi:hypothetical protein